MLKLSRYLPIVASLKGYDRGLLARDMIAALVVTIMLIPQSLAYALLAGVPPQVGLYASMLPLLAYALFGTSRTLSVGPVAIASLMTAVALKDVAEQGTSDYLTAAIVLALLSGILLMVMGVLRLGVLANLLSHSVVSGFITASALIIALSQMKHILGVSAHGDTLLELVPSLLEALPQTGMLTLGMGVSVILFLLFARRQLSRLLVRLGASAHVAGLLAKAAPVLSVIATILVVYLLRLDLQGVAVVGEVPQGLPVPGLPAVSMALVEQLLMPALVISIIGYVESISVGKTLAARHRQRIDSDQELIGLGAANVASAVSGGFPVTGGFSRSVVNYDAGAATQLAGVMTAMGIALTAMYLTPWLFYLPRATLAATIIVAVLALIDISIFRDTWRLSTGDFIAVLVTVIGTLFFGVEAGVAAGVVTSLGLHLYHATKPHITEVGLIAGTEHFRNVERHSVHTHPEIFSLRIDESLFFANAGYLEDFILARLQSDRQIRHVILMCSAINEIDFSALEMLEALNVALAELGITFHLSEVKGPVLDAIKPSAFMQELTGEIFLSQFQAFKTVSRLVSATEDGLSGL